MTLAASLTLGTIAALNAWPMRRRHAWAWLVTLALQPPLCVLDVLGGRPTVGFLLLTPPAVYNGWRGWREWRVA